MKAQIFKKFAFAIFGVFVLNTLANYFYWYESFPWADMVMHFLGGATISLFFGFIFFKAFSRLRENRKFLKAAIISSLLFLGVAILWEIMEFSVQSFFNIGHLLATLPDSISDTICGLAGNLVGIAYIFTKFNERDSYGRN